MVSAMRAIASFVIRYRSFPAGFRHQKTSSIPQGRYSLGIVLSLLIPAFLFLPLIKKFQNGVLHLLRGVGSGKVLPKLLVPEGNPLEIPFLYFIHDFSCGIQSEAAFLTQLFQTLCL